MLSFVVLLCCFPLRNTAVGKIMPDILFQFLFSPLMISDRSYWQIKVSGELRSSWFHSTCFLLQYLKETGERYLSFCCGIAHRVPFVLFSYLFSSYFIPVECLFIHQGGLSLLQLCLYTEGGCVYVCVFSNCGMLIVHLPIYTCMCMLL